MLGSRAIARLNIGLARDCALRLVESRMERRKFVKHAVTSLLIAPALVSWACGDDDPSPNPLDSGAGNGDGDGSPGDGDQSGDGDTGNGDGDGPPGDGDSGDGDGGAPLDASTDDAAAGDAGSDAGAEVCLNGAIDTEMTNQHPPGYEHFLAVPTEDVVAAQTKEYSIEGDSSHDHKITLTSAHFATLASGGSVTVTSSRDMGISLHDHVVTVACAPG
jgi:hypothetical protein